MKTISRRSWLGATGAAALGGSFVQAVENKGGGCLRGFGTYGLPDYSLKEAIELVSNTGFDSIEFASMETYHGAPDQIPTADRPEIRKQLIDSNLVLGALMGLPQPNAKKDITKATDWVKQMLELAHDLAPDPKSPPLIQGVLGGGKWEDQKSLYLDWVGPWVELASEAGIQLAIKPHRGQAMSRPDYAVWLIDQLNAKDKLSIVYDYSHFVFRDELTLEDTIATALPYTSYIVVKDSVEKDGKVRFQLPGESGAMPHAKILKAFYDGGYRGEVCCEVSSQVWRTEGYDPKTATETCYTNLTKIFADGGVPTL